MQPSPTATPYTKYQKRLRNLILIVLAICILAFFGAMTLMGLTFVGQLAGHDEPLPARTPEQENADALYFFLQESLY